MNLSRIYIACLWGVTLASIAAGSDWALRWNRASAAEQKLLLLPAQNPDEAARVSMAEAVRAHGAIASVDWISPQSLAQETASAVAPELWPSIFGEDQAWLPWIIEAKFRNPVGDEAAVTAAIGGLDADPAWQLVLWDAKGIHRARAFESRVLSLCVPAGILVFLLGLIGLARGSSRTSKVWVEMIVNGALAAGITAAFVGWTGWLGLAPDARVWQVAVGGSFLVAGLLAPMLKGTTGKTETRNPVGADG